MSTKRAHVSPSGAEENAAASHPVADDPKSKKVRYSTEPDTDEELEKAKEAPERGTLDAHIMSSKRKQSLDIIYVLKTAAKYSQDSPPMGVGIAVSKVQELKAKMVQAGRSEDFEAAKELKKQWEIYYAASEEQIKLYHLSDWLLKHSISKIEGHVAKMSYDKAAKWKERRDIAQSYLELVSPEDIDHILQKDTEVDSRASRFDADTSFEDDRSESFSPTTEDAVSTLPESNSTNETVDLLDDDDENPEDIDLTNDDEDDDCNNADKTKLSKQSRERGKRKYVTTGKVGRGKKPHKKPPKDGFAKFMRKTSHNVKRNKKPTETIVPADEGYRLSHGYLYCDHCKEQLCWDYRGKHAVMDKHKKNRDSALTVQRDLDDNAPKVQQRILEEQLVGSTYARQKIESQLLWLQVACKANWSLKSIEDNKDILNSVSSHPIPGRDELSQRYPDLKQMHVDKIKSLIAECFPQYGIIMDGTPLFAEAEALIIRLVHRKTFKIHQVLIHMELYDGSLDGEMIAQHVKDAITKSVALSLRNLRVTSIDRAGTNKKALNVLEQKDHVKSLGAYCVPHGLSGCGKKRDLTAAENVLKAHTGMVKYKLCKARTFFRLRFKERAMKRGGVRWGVEHELCAQIDRIGLKRLVDEWVTSCAHNKWSEQSAKKYIEAVEDPADFAIASVEIAALVDVGHPL
eukprot:scaffold206395_cov26-Cyclotella_meneghiniana.AAC.2